MEVHRGRCGANLQTPRAGRLGFGGLAAITDFDTPRCREASRPVGPIWFAHLRQLECARTEASPRPRFFRGAARKRMKTGVPGAAQRIRAMTHAPRPAQGDRSQKNCDQKNWISACANERTGEGSPEGKQKIQKAGQFARPAKMTTVASRKSVCGNRGGLRRLLQRGDAGSSPPSAPSRRRAPRSDARARARRRTRRRDPRA